MIKASEPSAVYRNRYLIGSTRRKLQRRVATVTERTRFLFFLFSLYIYIYIVYRIPCFTVCVSLPVGVPYPRGHLEQLYFSTDPQRCCLNICILYRLHLLRIRSFLSFHSFPTPPYVSFRLLTSRMAKLKSTHSVHFSFQDYSSYGLLLSEPIPLLFRSVLIIFKVCKLNADIFCSSTRTHTHTHTHIHTYEYNIIQL